MNKKQKKNLQRIIIALILVLILKLLPQFPTPVELVLYCIPYLVVGWDVPSSPQPERLALFILR